jgi:very-short-patch-repair endonuclease
MTARVPEKLLEHARLLRAHQANAENLLWMLMRGRQLGNFKFRRQHPLGQYILDFYCKEAALVVELDGGQHNEEASVSHDEQRTAVLREAGIHTIRFWNNEVFTNTEAVLEKIYMELVERSSPSPPPLSRRARGDRRS